MPPFEKRGKPEYLEKNLSEQRKQPTTNSTFIWRPGRHSNPEHFGAWKTSPLTTAPSLLPLKCLNGYMNAALLRSWLFWFLVCSSSKLSHIRCIAKLRLTCDQVNLLPFLFRTIPGKKSPDRRLS